MFGFFEELFAPGRTHTAEERKRLELSRVDLNTGDPARGPIDLSSGRVTVRATAHPPGPGTAAQETRVRERAGQEPPLRETAGQAPLDETAGQDDARHGG